MTVQASSPPRSKPDGNGGPLFTPLVCVPAGREMKGGGCIDELFDTGLFSFPPFPGQMMEAHDSDPNSLLIMRFFFFGIGLIPPTPAGSSFSA